MKKRLFFPLFLGVLALKLAALTPAGVVEKLYRANGNFSVACPAVEIVREARNVASYRRRSNVIALEEKAVLLCRKMGRDSADALAFILGHELMHAFQREGWKAESSSFLAHAHAADASTHHEKEADVGGVFLTWLAGFRSVEQVPQIIQSVYEAYDLKGKNLPGYPPFDERLQTGKDVQSLVRQLIALFETANFLAAAGQHELAAAAFSHIETAYKSREVYNNLGINAALQALNLGDANAHRFALPLELDWKTRLKKPRVSRGGAADAFYQERRRLFQRAEGFFEKSRQFDGSSFSTVFNLFCLKILLDGGERAITFYEKEKLASRANDVSEKEKLRLALGVAYAEAGMPGLAEKQWAGLSKSKNPLTKILVKDNLAALKDKPFSKKKRQTSGEACPDFGLPKGAVDGVEMCCPPVEGPYAMLSDGPKIEVLTLQKTASTVLIFRRNGLETLVLQRVRQEKTLPPDLKNAPPVGVSLPGNGFLWHCPAGKTVVRVGEGKVLEWARYDTF